MLPNPHTSLHNRLVRPRPVLRSGSLLLFVALSAFLSVINPRLHLDEDAKKKEKKVTKKKSRQKAGCLNDFVPVSYCTTVVFSSNTTFRVDKHGWCEGGESFGPRFHLALPLRSPILLREERVESGRQERGNQSQCGARLLSTVNHVGSCKLFLEGREPKRLLNRSAFYRVTNSGKKRKKESHVGAKARGRVEKKVRSSYSIAGDKRVSPGAPV